jgi:hypothetical protein
VGWEAFEGVVSRNPGAGLRLLRILADRIGVLEERLADVAYRGVPAAWLARSCVWRRARG